MKKAEQLSAAFAYGCRRTGELGIDEELREFASTGQGRKRICIYLKQLEPYFYYQLIARANGMKDIFSQRIIKAYWIGNELLEKITPKHVQQALGQAEFKLKVKNNFLLTGGKAHHNYTVLAAVPIKSVQFLELVNNCVISWGKVEKIEDGRLLVSTQLINLKNQKWVLGNWQKREINKGLIKNVRIGDWLAIHFGEARYKLSQADYRQLKKYTQSALTFFNLSRVF